MKFITDYIELDTGTDKSIIEHISKDPIDEKAKVLDYLKNGTETGVYCSSVYDYPGCFSTGETIHCLTDGEYEWDTEEIYHFEKYNMELDEGFIKKAISA